MVGTVSIWGWIILCCGCYPLCCRIFIFSSTPLPFLGSFPGCLVVKKKKKKKKATSKCWRCRRHRFNPWVGKIPWRRNWQPTAVFLLGKSHRWRSLVGYSPWGRRVGLSNWADTHSLSSPVPQLWWPSSVSRHCQIPLGDKITPVENTTLKEEKHVDF